jgi:hypothetical protein
MERILSAIFDNRRDADAAISELVLSDFPRASIRLGSGDPAEATAKPGETPGDPSGRAGAIAAESGNNFFHSLFGTDNSVHVTAIDGAVTHSHLVLTVALPSLTEVERAAAIVERYGPLDIDSLAIGADDGVQSMTPPPAPSSYQSGPLSQQQAEPPGASHAGGSGNMQRAGAEDGAIQDLGREQLRGQANAAETYPGDEHYDEYAPAYLYGLDMATHEQHGGKEWHEAEPALRGEWERRHPQSAWDTFRHAVQRGWDKLRGGHARH